VGGFPRLGAVLATGEISREHVNVLVPSLRRVPQHLLTSEGKAKADQLLTEASRDLPPQDAEKVSRHLLAVLDPEGTDRFDPNASERRELSVTADSTGMVVVRGYLDAHTGGLFMAMCDRFGKPDPAGDQRAEDGTVHRASDPRSRLVGRGSPRPVVLPRRPDRAGKSGDDLRPAPRRRPCRPVEPRDA
jgi:hypothetical protein